MFCILQGKTSNIMALDIAVQVLTELLNKLFNRGQNILL